MSDGLMTHKEFDEMCSKMVKDFNRRMTPNARQVKEQWIADFDSDSFENREKGYELLKSQGCESFNDITEYDISMCRKTLRVVGYVLEPLVPSNDFCATHPA